MIELTLSYYVATVTAAGFPDCEKVEQKQEFETNDIEHALELAERQWIEPEDYMAGTLVIN